MNIQQKIIVGEIANHIDDIPERSGLYAFFLRMNELSTNSLEQYSKFFHIHALSIEITQQPKEQNWALAEYLRSRFVHKDLTNLSKVKDGIINAINSNHDKLLEIATQILTPPIYIGSTGDLNQRIYEHLKDLGIITSSTNSDKENNFGSRLTEISKNVDFFNANNLIVKYIYDEDEELLKDDFEVIEKYMLSTVKPVLSLK